MNARACSRLAWMLSMLLVLPSTGCVTNNLWESRAHIEECADALEGFGDGPPGSHVVLRGANGGLAFPVKFTRGEDLLLHPPTDAKAACVVYSSQSLRRLLAASRQRDADTRPTIELSGWAETFWGNGKGAGQQYILIERGGDPRSSLPPEFKTAAAELWPDCCQGPQGIVHTLDARECRVLASFDPHYRVLPGETAKAVLLTVPALLADVVVTPFIGVTIALGMHM